MGFASSLARAARDKVRGGESGHTPLTVSDVRRSVHQLRRDREYMLERERRAGIEKALAEFGGAEAVAALATKVKPGKARGVGELHRKTAKATKGPGFNPAPCAANFRAKFA